MNKADKILRGIGMGGVGVFNVACGLVIQAAVPFSRLMGDSSPKNEAFENSKYFFQEAVTAFEEAMKDD